MIHGLRSVERTDARALRFLVREGPSEGINDFGIELCPRFWQAAEKR
jgi:hypothetical protein